MTAALAVMTTASGAAHAQEEADGLARASAALRDRALEAIAGCEDGALVIRPRAVLPSDAPQPHQLVVDVLAPALEALRADPRFSRVDVALFAGEGGDASRVARRLGYRWLLDLDVGVERHALAIEARLHTTETDAASPRVVLSEPLDLALRRYLGFPARRSAETLVVRHARMPGRGYLALAVADLDGDGQPEIVAVHGQGARILRARSGGGALRLEDVGDARWPSDAPLAPSRRRRALATAITRDGSVVTRTSDLAPLLAVRLRGGRPEVTEVTDGPCPAPRFPMEAGCAELVDGRDFFDQAITSGDGTRQAQAHFFAHVERRLASRAGGAATFEALVTPHGRLWIRVRDVAGEEEGEAAEAERTNGALGYGTALAMTDLDLDGSAELLASHAAPADALDQLSLLRVLPRGALHVVWRSDPLEGPVWIAGAGDVDGDGLEELIAIEEPRDDARGARARLWVIE